MTHRRPRWIRAAAISGLVLCAAALFVLCYPLTLLDSSVRVYLWSRGVHSRYVDADGLRLHYLEADSTGAAGGTPLLLIHGLGARALDWSPLIPALARAGFHVYALDLPGYGLSARPDADYSIRYEEAATLAFAKAMHLHQPDVAGWSMGGWIALRLAADHPDEVRRLVLLDSAGIYFNRHYDDRLFTPTDLAGVQLLWQYLTPRPGVIPGFLARAILRRSKRNAWVIHRSLASMLSGRDLMQFRLGEVQAPTIVLWGLADRLIPPDTGERIAKGIPNATFVGIPGCGHLMPSECAAAALPPMIRFLRGDSVQPTAKSAPSAGH